MNLIVLPNQLCLIVKLYINRPVFLPDTHVSDDKNELNRVYKLYKERLANKYGEKDDESDEDGNSVSYVGNNNITLTLSNIRGKSNGGEYRRYVVLNYMDMAIMEQMSKLSNDEL